MRNNWSMTRSITLIVFLIFCTLTGCLGQRSWEYPPASRGTFLDITAITSIPARVVVLPLQDLRGDKTHIDHKYLPLPLISKGSTMYERPETAPNPYLVDEVQFDPPQDFARAIAAELENAQIFSSVIFANENEVPPADLVLRGTLRSTQWKRNMTTYYLGPLGSALWFMGLPLGNTTTKLVLDLTLTPVNASTPTPVWSFSMDFQEKLLDGPYYGWEDAVLSYPIALQDALREAIIDLVNISHANPKFWTKDRTKP